MVNGSRTFQMEINLSSPKINRQFSIFQKIIFFEIFFYLEKSIFSSKKKLEKMIFWEIENFHIFFRELFFKIIFLQEKIYFFDGIFFPTSDDVYTSRLYAQSGLGVTRGHSWSDYRKNSFFLTLVYKSWSSSPNALLSRTKSVQNIHSHRTYDLTYYCSEKEMCTLPNIILPEINIA